MLEQPGFTKKNTLFGNACLDISKDGTNYLWDAQSQTNKDLIQHGIKLKLEKKSSKASYNQLKELQVTTAAAKNSNNEVSKRDFENSPLASPLKSQIEIDD